MTFRALASTLVFAVLVTALAPAADAQSKAFPNGRVDPCDEVSITLPVESGATSANVLPQFMAAQQHEACAHTWPPGTQACKHYTAAADGYNIAAALSMKPSERIAQFTFWTDAKRVYGWAMAYCTNPDDKDRASRGYAEAVQRTYVPPASP
jgi:hypothetical protein